MTRDEKCIAFKLYKTKALSCPLLLFKLCLQLIQMSLLDDLPLVDDNDVIIKRQRLFEQLVRYT
ncbi:hypothetical protein [Paenibacillus caui]|uniref:hypothetical protein n=1 Tax=Paenibacillus caui TaxID=2873927 RepID=UPI001CA80323|nr:hypothetical protein [Paenibacillus caui]